MRYRSQIPVQQRGRLARGPLGDCGCELGDSATSEALFGKTRQHAVKWLYKLVGNKFRGFFSDTDWAPVAKVFQLLRSNGVFIELKSAYYRYSPNQDQVKEMPANKVWEFEIPFINNTGRLHIIYGSVIASGAGPVADRLARYDLIVTFG